MTTIKKSKKSNYYAIDISNIMSSIYNINKFIGFHPEFFNTNINKRIIYVNDTLINIYLEPLYFKDTIHNMRGYIISDYDNATKNFKMVLNIRISRKNKSSCYVKQIETYIENQSKYGDTIQLQYNKILSDVIIKHCFYEQPTNQWLQDVVTLQEQFFLPEKDYLLSIMNNKINNANVGSASNSWNNLILHGAPGLGKCHGIDTPILMYNGSIKYVQDLAVGDLVMGDDSIQRTVLSTTTGSEMMYVINQEYDTYTVNKSHILSLVYYKLKTFYCNKDSTYSVVWECKDHKTYTKIFKYDGEAMRFYHSINTETYVDISVEDYLKLAPFMQKKLFGYRNAIEFQEKLIGANPYILGLWVGYTNTNIYNEQYALMLSYITQNCTLDINKIGIPNDLKINSRIIRLNVLAGIIDYMAKYNCITDVYTINIYNEQFTNDIIYLCKSLGYSAFITDDKINITGQNLYKIPVYNQKKKSTFTSLNNNNLHFDIVVIEKATETYYGFTLDKNHKFVLGNFIVTHNSSFVYRVSMTLKMSILSVDLSLYLNKKKELYALFHGQEFSLPNSTDKEPALTNYIIVLEEFDTAIEKLLDIENIFKYKDILKRNYLDLKNKEIKKKALTFVNNTNDSDIDTVAPPTSSDDYEGFMEELMLQDGFDTKNNKVLDRAREDILEQRDQGNELNSINIELDNIIKSMDTDNKSNIVRLADLLELFQGPVPIAGRIIIATTNNFTKIKKSLPALCRSGRLTSIEFTYLDWASLNKLTDYYFKQQMTLEPFLICIATSQIIELAIKINLNKQAFIDFENELLRACVKL